MSWPWGAYLGEEGLTKGISAKISSWQRIGPNVIPHVAKATGVYLNSMLAVTEANRAGYDEAILLTAEGHIADGSGENIFLVKNGELFTPDLSASILPGITRDTVIQIAQDLGYSVHEKPLIRSDLYLADEAFMTGTAAEVTPLRAVDDVEIGVGPITLEIQETYLDTARGRSERWAAVARVRHAGARRGLSTGTREIPLARPYLDEREEELVLEVLRSGRLSLGPTIDRFEELMAERIGAPYVAAVSSGTAGLHLLSRIAGLGPGDEAITSPISFASSANCFMFEGATPVFADVDPRTLNLDPAAVEAAITPRTKAVVAVDMFGYPCELDELRALCCRHGLALIEDAAEALGAEYKGAPDRLAWAVRRLRVLSQQAARDRRGRRRLHALRGGVAARSQPAKPGARLRGRRMVPSRSSRLELPVDGRQAAIGIGQLEKLDRLLALRSEAAARYSELLDGSGVEPLCADDADHRRSWFVYVVAVPQGIDRDSRDRRAARRRGSERRTTSRASTCSRTCARRTASRRARARWRRPWQRERWRCRSIRSSRPRTRNASPRSCARRCRD